MEDSENIFQTQQQAVSKTEPKVGKPPTRLQRQAPSSLDLNHVVNTNTNPNTNNFIANKVSASPDAQLAAIPLLSPLVASPQALPTEPEDFKFPKFGDNDMGLDDDDVESVIIPSIPGGWQHPAVAGYTEPSALFSFFQSKCVLVTDAQ